MEKINAIRNVDDENTIQPHEAFNYIDDLIRTFSYTDDFERIIKTKSLGATISLNTLLGRSDSSFVGLEQLLKERYNGIRCWFCFDSSERLNLFFEKVTGLDENNPEEDIGQATLSGPGLNNVFQFNFPSDYTGKQILEESVYPLHSEQLIFPKSLVRSLSTNFQMSFPKVQNSTVSKSKVAFFEDRNEQEILAFLSQQKADGSLVHAVRYYFGFSANNPHPIRVLLFAVGEDGKNFIWLDNQKTLPATILQKSWPPK